MKYILNKTLLLLFAVLCFTGCKKYPKNVLWWKKPVGVLGRGLDNPWKLVYYSVNDVDSTNADFLKVWRMEGIVFDPENWDNSTHPYKCYDLYEGFWELNYNKKRINFLYGYYNYTNSNSNPSYTNQRNIFLESNLSWKIDKLCPGDFRIIKEYKGLKYEIHFK